VMSSGRWVFPGRPASSNKAIVPDYAPRRTTPDPFAVRSWAIGDTFCLDTSRAKARRVDLSERSSLYHRFVSGVWSVRVTTSPKDTHCVCERRRICPQPPQQEPRTDQLPLPSAPAQTAGDGTSQCPPIRRESKSAGSGPNTGPGAVLPRPSRTRPSLLKGSAKSGHSLWRVTARPKDPRRQLIPSAWSVTVVSCSS
jgi:hypothetical protein